MVANAFTWGKLVKCQLKGKTCSKLANGLNFNDLKKALNTGVILTLPWGYIHAYNHSSQTSLLVSQVSGERLQDHWSSDSWFEPLCIEFSLCSHKLEVCMFLASVHLTLFRLT